jgi:hypothetical protein
MRYDYNESSQYSSWNLEVALTKNPAAPNTDLGWVEYNQLLISVFQIPAEQDSRRRRFLSLSNFRKDVRQMRLPHFLQVRGLTPRNMSSASNIAYTAVVIICCNVWARGRG